MARGLEALHPLLALPGGLVRVLGTVVKIPVLPMFHSWKDLALSGAVARQFVSDEDARYAGQPFKEFTEKFLCGLLVSPPLH